MPRGSPFTALCQQSAALQAQRVVADLHSHTLASDGDFTPSQLVAFAAQSGIRTLAITDHDTFAGFEDARSAVVQFPRLELIRGVEITTRFDGQETHLLAYWFQGEPSPALGELLLSIRQARYTRFEGFLHQLADRGLRLDTGRVARVQKQSPALGRRHLASLLVEQGLAPHRQAAMREFVPSSLTEYRERLPELEAVLALVRESGGVSSLAHPRAELTRETLDCLAEAGLTAVEVAHPAIAWGRSQELRQWCAARQLGLSGGSDCHGSERRIGTHGLLTEELARLRRLADCRDRTSLA